MAFGFQLPTYGKKKEEEQYMTKAPIMSVTPQTQPSSKTPTAPQGGKAPIIPREPMMSYNIEGTIMPGVSDVTAKNLQKYVSENAKTPEESKLLMSDMYQEAVKVQQRKAYEKDRNEMKATMVQKSLSTSQPEEKKSIETALKLANLSDIIREGAKAQGLDAWSMNDKDVVAGFGSSNPDKQQTILDYLNGKITSVDVGREIGLIPQDEVPVEEESKGGLGQTIKNIIGGVGDSATGLFQWIGNMGAERAYKQFVAGGVPEEEARKYIDGFKNYLEESKISKTSGADTESFGYKASKTVGDIAQIANPAGLGKIGMVAGDVASTVAKAGSLVSKVAKGATMGAVDTAVFMPQSEQRLATGKEIALGATIGGAIPLATAGAKALKKAPEIVARKLTQTSSAQDKLFKAQNPTLNVLNKNRKFKTVRAESDLANDLVVRAGHKPVDTETRRIAHEATMKSKRAEVESRVKDRKTFYVDQRQFAKIIEDTVADVKKSGLVKNTADIKALEAEAKAMRKQQFIDLPSLEKKKQYINGIVNNRGDSAIGDVYKNGMKKVTRAIGEVEDATLAKIPGEFSNIKKEFGALKATYEDVLKADLKNQKAKGMDIMESYSRIEGIGDILGGTLSIFTKGSEGLKDVAKGAGKLFMGKVLKKMKDADFLVKEGFEDLSSKIKPNATKIPSMNNTTKPIGGMGQAKTKVKAPLQEKIDRPVVRVKAPEEPLIAEARKYKSAEEFVDSQLDKQYYRSAHQLKLSDSITADKIDISKLKEQIRTRRGYLNNDTIKGLKKLEQLQGNPNEQITIYRASPKEGLNDGDWVTTNKVYANDIKRQNGGKVYSYTAKVGDLRFPIDVETLPSVAMESTFSYSPKTTKLKQIREQANSKGLPIKK